MPELEVQPGALLAGKYRVERVLGRGGMGVVVEATQIGLERRVALKFLRHVALKDSGEALTRFEREARTVARLKGTHIVQVHDVGRLEQGEPFIVMELLDGEDMKAALDREKSFSVAVTVEYLAQVCEAMAEAHVAGVVHRDLKPANLFIARRADGRPLVKVLDFGISKLMTETTSLNLTSGALGSPLYMSPEQLTSSRSIDYRTDIWSLGAILYEMLTGSDAFEADGIAQVCARILAGRPDAMSRPGREIPRGLEDAVLRCLCREPAERFLTVADLAMALMPFAKRAACASIETAVRIVQASNLRHAGLPNSFDSLPPPAAAKETQPMAHAKTLQAQPPFTVKSEPDSVSAPTIDVRGAGGPSTVGGVASAMAHTVPAGAAAVKGVAFDKTMEAGPVTTAALQTGAMPAQTTAAAAAQTAPRAAAPAPLRPLVFEKTMKSAGVTQPVRPAVPAPVAPAPSRLLPILLGAGALLVTGGVLLAVQLARGSSTPADSATPEATKAPVVAAEPTPIASVAATPGAAPAASITPPAAPEPTPSAAPTPAPAQVSKPTPVVRKPRPSKLSEPSADDMLKHR